MYIDKQSFEILWKDIFDRDGKMFKMEMLLHFAGPVPGEGVQVGTYSTVETMWDLNKQHLTTFITSGPEGIGTLANEACRSVNGVNYDDFERYSTVGGARPGDALDTGWGPSRGFTIIYAAGGFGEARECR